uniref:Sex hormone-binding globulin n=1 Tax=Gopherus evgoodei TaxID=1825980 RepID=A0A8C4Y761_9SAUR
IFIDLSKVTSAASSFDFRTLDPEGVIFFGDMGDHSDWFVLGLRRGKAEMQISNVVTNISVRGGQRLDDGQWHRTPMDGCLRRWIWLNQSTTWWEGTPMQAKAKPCFSALRPGSFFPGGGAEGGETPSPQEWGTFRGCLQGIRVQGHQLDLDSALFRSNTIWAHSCPTPGSGLPTPPRWT